MQHRYEAIAELANYQPYQWLVENLEEEVNQLTADMTTAKTDAELLKLTRLWQVLYKFYVILRDTPHNVMARVEAERAEARQYGVDQSENDFLGALTPDRAALLKIIEKTVAAGTEKKRKR